MVCKHSGVITAILRKKKGKNQFWTILDHVRPFWTIFVDFGPFWTISDHFKLFMNILENFERILFYNFG